VRVLVLGGGPAGATAALHAAELGAEVTLVERDRLGGTALNSGPAPVRTLARAARLVRDWSSWETFGLRGAGPKVDLAATLANAERVANHAYERRRVAEHIRAMGVDLAEEAGDARFLDADTVAASDGRTWNADRVIIAVGGRAGRLPIPGAELGLTYEDVRSLTALPGRVCVIGAADTGCQLASILADFGCRGTLVEYAPRIVPRADQDVSAALEQAFCGRGIEVVTGASVERQALGSGVRIVYGMGDETTTIQADATFFAVGWPSNADLVDGAHAGATIDRGYVVVDDYLRTSVPHIFAAGDVDGHSMLVSKRHPRGSHRIRECRARASPPTRSRDRPHRELHRSRVRQRRAHRTAGARPVRVRGGRRPVRGSAAPGRRLSAGGLLQADRRDRAAADRRRPRARRVLGRGDPDGRRLHGGWDARRGGRRAPVRLPHVHRRIRPGRPDDRTRARSQRHAPALEQPAIPGAAIRWAAENRVSHTGFP